MKDEQLRILERSATKSDGDMTRWRLALNRVGRKPHGDSFYRDITATVTKDIAETISLLDSAAKHTEDYAATYPDGMESLSADAIIHAPICRRLLSNAVEAAKLLQLACDQLPFRSMPDTSSPFSSRWSAGWWVATMHLAEDRARHATKTLEVVVVDLERHEDVRDCQKKTIREVLSVLSGLTTSIGDGARTSWTGDPNHPLHGPRPKPAPFESRAHELEALRDAIKRCDLAGGRSPASTGSSPCPP